MDILTFLKLHNLAHQREDLTLEGFEKDFLEEASKLGIKVEEEVEEDEEEGSQTTTREVQVNVEILGEIEYIKRESLSADQIRKKYTKNMNMEIARELGIDFETKEKELAIATKIYETIFGEKK